MNVVWNEHHRTENLNANGLDLALADEIDWQRAIVLPFRSGRYTALGMLGRRLVSVVFEPIGADTISVISMITASEKERAIYADS